MTTETNNTSQLPRMVAKRNREGQSGYPVIAECDFDPNGVEIRFSEDLISARGYAQALVNDPSRWMNERVGAVAVFNVSSAKIVERY